MRFVPPRPGFRASRVQPSVQNGTWRVAQSFARFCDGWGSVLPQSCDQTGLVHSVTPQEHGVGATRRDCECCSDFAPGSGSARLLLLAAPSDRLLALKRCFAILRHRLLSVTEVNGATIPAFRRPFDSKMTSGERHASALLNQISITTEIT